eukprot:scaffold44620_cov30-Phaeocystis_antarctica.AAC.1
MARMMSAEYGGMRKGNSYVISARSAASSWKWRLLAWGVQGVCTVCAWSVHAWKLMLLAPPPASATSKTLESAGTMGAVSTPRGMKSWLGLGLGIGLRVRG